MSLKYILLSELANGEKAGYDIVKSFDSSVGYFWNATHQQVYRELKQLFKAELIHLRLQSQSAKPDKKFYTITTKGLDELIRWVNQPLAPIPVRDQLLVKIHAASFVGTAEVLAELARSRQQIMQILQTYLLIEQNHYSNFSQVESGNCAKALYIALRKGIIGAKAHITWLDEAVALYTGN